jgi:EAL domain-containing protein (putative c-di-GMP-specific phosphodiesterase class I)/GGDEF domain-containing protein
MRPALGITNVMPNGDESRIIRSEYLVDRTAKLGVDEVRLSSKETEWKAISEDTPNFGYQKYPYWYRYELKNDTTSLKEQIIEISYPLLDYVDFYEFENGELLQEIHIGDREPYSKRIIDHPNLLLPVSIEAGETHQIYMRVITNGAHQVPLSISDATSLFIRLGKEDALHATYYGVVSVIIFFNLMIFIALREKQYLYYSLSALCYMLFFAVMKAKLFAHFFPNTPAVHHALMLTLIPLSLLLSALFSREFLRPEKYSKTLGFLVNAIILVTAACLVGTLVLDAQTSLKVSVLCAIPIGVILFILGPTLGFMGNKMAWVYTLAWSTFMFGVTITALSKQGLVASSFITEYGMQLGSALELFILNAALASRFYQEHRQRIAAQEISLSEHIERRGAEQRLLSKSLLDQTTQLPNRSCFEQQANLEIESRDKTRLAICVIEILRYPEISRTLGHQNTDLMQVEVGRKLNALMADLPGIIKIKGPTEEVFICSLQPGSFVMMVEADLAERQTAQSNETLKRVMQPIEFMEMRLELRPAIGVAVYPEHGKDTEALLRHAQVAADSSEAFERHLSYYRPEYDQYNERRLMMVSELKEAIRDDHLALYFQPKYSLKESRVVGIEALVRWNHARYGLIRPDEFIEIAEKTGLIRTLTRWVVSHALSAQQLLKNEGHDLNMSINMSALNLKEGDLIEFLGTQITEHGSDPQRVFLELTETSMMENPLDAIEVLTKIRELGLQIAIDDFGAGYSSLAYLKSLPATEIKIDKSLISGICGNGGSDTIAEATINMCHELEYSVVAEGVENEETLEHLSNLGCDKIQGYLLTPPLPYEKILAWLDKSESDNREVS